MSKIEIVCSPSSASHQPSTELRQDVGPAWQLLLCFRQGAIGVLVKQHPGLLSPQAFGEGLIWGHRVRTYQAWWLNSRSTKCLLLLCISHVICIYVIYGIYQVMCLLPFSHWDFVQQQSIVRASSNFQSQKSLSRESPRRQNVPSTPCPIPSNHSRSHRADAPSERHVGIAQGCLYIKIINTQTNTWN